MHHLTFGGKINLQCNLCDDIGYFNSFFVTLTVLHFLIDIILDRSLCHKLLSPHQEAAGAYFLVLVLEQKSCIYGDANIIYGCWFRS